MDPTIAPNSVSSNNLSTGQIQLKNWELLNFQFAIH